MSDQIGRAFETREFAQLPSLFTSGFKCTLPDGAVLGREQFLTAFKADAEEAVPPVRVSTRLRKLDINRNRAVSIWAEVTEYSAKNARGTMHRLRYSQEFESGLVRTQGKWLMDSLNHPAQARLSLDGEGPMRSIEHPER